LRGIGSKNCWDKKKDGKGRKSTTHHQEAVVAAVVAMVVVAKQQQQPIPTKYCCSALLYTSPLFPFLLPLPQSFHSPSILISILLLRYLPILPNRIFPYSWPFLKK
jgi:hypothetical protein